MKPIFYKGILALMMLIMMNCGREVEINVDNRAALPIPPGCENRWVVNWCRYTPRCLYCSITDSMTGWQVRDCSHRLVSQMNYCAYR